MTTIDNLMALADAYKDAAESQTYMDQSGSMYQRKVAKEKAEESREALRAALTEALAQPNIKNYPEKDNSVIGCVQHDCAECKSREAQPDGLIPAGSWEHLKLLMQGSAWDEKIQLDDALANIDSFAHEYSPQPAREPLPTKWAEFLHYPGCWDTAAYPTLESAVHEALAWSGCAECKPRRKHGIGGDK